MRSQSSDFPDDRMLIGEVLYFGNVAGLVAVGDPYDGT